MEPYITYGDERLLTLARENDPEAFAVLYRRYRPLLYATAYRRLRDKAQCQDIVQHVFADLWKRKERLAIGNLPAYLHTAVWYLINRHAARAYYGTAYIQVAGETVASSCRADSLLLEKELRVQLQMWIDALPPRRKKIFLMHYDKGWPTGQIAICMHISQKTVQNQLHMATVHIRKRLM